jgi:hypothetical protein
MTLFREPPTTDQAPARHGEPRFAYLQRTGRPLFARVRRQMDAWLAEVPRHHRAELVTRLRNLDDHHFEAAFFELYLHALFRRLGYRLQLHPRAGGRGRRPDFLATSASQAFLVEATTVDETSTTERGERARLKAVFDAINAVECPDYFLHVEHSGHLATPVSGRQLRHAITSFIGQLDYESLSIAVQKQGMDGMPSMNFQHGEFNLEISVIPVSRSHRGDTDHRPLGVSGRAEAQWIDDRTPLRNKIRSKAAHYGSLRRPLLLAVNGAGRDLELMDVMEALFGKETWLIGFGPNGEETKPEMSRRPDGAWLGPRGPQNRTVSAVLVVSSLLPWTVAVHEPIVYHNPWARYPIADLSNRLTQFRASGDQMVEQTGDPVHEILGLRAGWPREHPDD